MLAPFECLCGNFILPEHACYVFFYAVFNLRNLLYIIRNRWCGAYWASKGIRVIPTVNWGDESTFDFCFEGIEKGSVVAVSTYMASEHDNRCDQKEWFMAGYNEMLRRIEPEKIICYNTPFPEMRGNIVYVDYERSSWKYMSYERNCKAKDLDAFKIGETYRPERDTIEPYLIGGAYKGGGSAYGGAWKPSKPEDHRLIGKPGEIKVTYAKDGSKVETKIGSDGRAVAERHHTTAPNPKFHSNPHDHKINWEFPRKGVPNFEKPHTNYWSDEYPNGAPEFKAFRGAVMKYTFNSAEENCFKTISDFKECIIRGGEPVFFWKGLQYGVCFYGNKYCIALTNGEQEKICDTPDDVLDYLVGEDRLRDIITQVTVLHRNV